MVNQVEGSTEVQEESCCELPIICSLKPEINKTNECSSGAVVWAEPMMIWMPESVFIKVIEDLFCHHLLTDHADIIKVTDRPIIFCQLLISLFMVWLIFDTFQYCGK